MEFEWDEEKNRLNILKHKVSFIKASLVFRDVLRKEYFDLNHSGADEERYIVIGNSEGRILFVVFTEVDSNIIRIISARKAKKYEKELYYGYSTN
jgi:uncharacterized DUF497 family protein